MAKWHVKLNGEPALCEATIMDCPRGGADRHFDTKEEAEEWFESTMVGSLISTIKSKAPRFKKVARIGASVSIAFASLAGVSNIATAAEASPAWLDSLDEIVSDSGVTDYLDDLTRTLDEAADVANDWLNKDSVKNSKINRKVESVVNDTPGYAQFEKLFNHFFGRNKSGGATGSNIPSATVVDDGSIQWQGKSLTPSKQELAEARATLDSLVVMPETGGNYDREVMYGSASETTRSMIEERELFDARFNDRARAVSGTLKDPYTGEIVSFSNSERPYDLEHLVSLKEAYRSENPNSPLTEQERYAIANDPDNLLLVTSSANRSKSDKDAKDWVPSYAPSEARFAISTIKVKAKYGLTVDPGEYEALSNILKDSGY